MNNEIRNNQKEQRRSLKKYRKHIGKILLWGGVAVASAFVFPYGGIFNLLKGVIGESLAMNAVFFTQWGITGAGLIGGIMNAIKAKHERGKLENAQDEAEDLADGLVNENDELKRKVEELAKDKTKELDKESPVKTMSDKEKEYNTRDIEEVDEVEKRRTR